MGVSVGKMVAQTTTGVFRKGVKVEIICGGHDFLCAPKQNKSVTEVESMVAKQLIPILLAGAIVSSVGCSGSRLRNMVGRSDYQSLEELDALDGDKANESEAVAQYEAGERSGKLVSQTSELPAEPEDDIATIEKKRKGFFDFVKVFNRNSDREEFAPDPFAEPASPGETAKTIEGAKPTASVEQKLTADAEAEETTPDFSSTMANVEKQAEALFEEGLMNKDVIAAATETAGADIASAAFGPQSPQEQSFADFINQQEKTVEATVADVQQEVQSVIHSVSETKEAASPFDEFLNEMHDVEAEPVVADESSALFPELSEAFDEAFEAAETESSPFTEVAEVAEVAEAANPFDESIPDDESPFVEVQESSFVETTQKHGFDTKSTNDPWAAFDRNSKTLGEERRTASVTSSNDFNWGRPKVSEQPAPETSFTDASDENPFASDDQPFLHVSSTRTLDTQEPVDMSASMPLVIPGTSGIQGFDVSEPVPVSNDPFLTSVPTFDESTSEPVIDPVPATTTVAADGGLLQWSRRTWFLLIGCLIVALLLFMPDRHNRTNE